VTRQATQDAVWRDCVSVTAHLRTLPGGGVKLLLATPLSPRGDWADGDGTPPEASVAKRRAAGWMRCEDCAQWRRCGGGASTSSSTALIVAQRGAASARIVCKQMSPKWRCDEPQELTNALIDEEVGIPPYKPLSDRQRTAANAARDQRAAAAKAEAAAAAAALTAQTTSPAAAEAGVALEGAEATDLAMEEAEAQAEAQAQAEAEAQAEEEEEAAAAGGDGASSADASSAATGSHAAAPALAPASGVAPGIPDTASASSAAAPSPSAHSDAAPAPRQPGQRVSSEAHARNAGAANTAANAAPRGGDQPQRMFIDLSSDGEEEDEGGSHS